MPTLPLLVGVLTLLVASALVRLILDTSLFRKSVFYDQDLEKELLVALNVAT